MTFPMDERRCPLRKDPSSAADHFSLTLTGEGIPCMVSRWGIRCNVIVDAGLTESRGQRIAEEVEACLMEKFDDRQQVIIHIDPSMQ